MAIEPTTRRVDPDTGSTLIQAWLGRRRIPALLEPLEAALRAHNPKADLGAIERAYTVAERAHEGQRRKSGEPYITHPVAVATIVAELGMSDTVIQAALLHDTVEDTDYSLEMLTADFGAEVAMLVDGVTKLDKVQFGEAAQAETVRKMVVAMARDIRVLIVKLADRLHNARTWAYVSVESAQHKARETLEIYAPLAHRMGMNTIKWELEDLSFATLYPKIYAEIVDLVTSRAPEREEFIAVVRDELNAMLRKSKIRAAITARPKHFYSVYQKMIVRGRDFDEINDLVGVRVLVDTVKDCYNVLGEVHALWNPVAGRVKDYVAMPKFNLYQSLHTTVIGPGGRQLEVQIRTHDMHRRAEYGVAAHWKYKDRSKTAGGDQVDLAWVRNLFDWQQETAEATEFLEGMRYEMSFTEIYVFTPKGQVISLPQGATPIDFAYAVHTEVGHHTMGAKVNGRLVPLDSPISHGDVVEILTSKAAGAGPSRDWLSFVQSQRARNKIRQWFTKERREEAIEQGKEAIAKQMRKQDLPLQRLLTHDAMAVVAAEMRLADVSALYASVGEGVNSAVTVVKKLIANTGGESANEEDLSEIARPGSPRTSRSGDPGVAVLGLDDVLVKLAKCCTPMPGDDIIGFVTRSTGVSVHRTDCGNVETLKQQPERLIEVEWTGTARGVYLVQIRVEALDRSRLLSDVTRVLSDNHVNILSAAVQTTKDRVAISKFVFELAEPSHLAAVLAAVRKVEGVYDVSRITGSGGRRPD